MWTPTCLGQPGKVSDAEYYCAADDRAECTRNSGVVNHSYALLVDGGTYNGVTVEGIGLDKAAGDLLPGPVDQAGADSGFPELADALEDVLRRARAGGRADQGAQHGSERQRRTRPT